MRLRLVKTADMTESDFEQIRADVEKELDPEWLARYGDWSWAAALALFGETDPKTHPPHEDASSD